MPPKKKKRKKKKKAPLFYTDIDDLLPFGVRANELITTPLGVVATVLGVKYKVKGDKSSGRLWVQYRCGYQCPLETQLEQHKRYPDGENVWKSVAQLQERQRKEDELRYKVDEFNRKQELEAKNKKKKLKPKKPKENAPAGSAPSAPPVKAPSAPPVKAPPAPVKAPPVPPKAPPALKAPAKANTRSKK